MKLHPDRRPGTFWTALATSTAASALAGCQGIQSSLAPQGPEAERIAVVSTVLFIGGGIIMVAVLILTAIAILGRESWRNRLSREAVVVGGGIVFPAVTLTVLLAYGLLATRAGDVAAEGSEPLRISVVGKQWWWRVIYADANGNRFESANEIRIPTGRPAELSLTTDDVIHSFWVPHLAGKVDMIPGRTNTLTLTASGPGVSRGQCAEYCGGAHALMAFHVVAMEPGEFERWVAREAGPAEPPDGPSKERGQRLFLSSGCGACHTIRGTEANGKIGPDLTHVGSRTSLAAGTLSNNAQSIAAWIERNQHIKPENRMPPFKIFTASELTAVSEYLAGLR